MLVRRGGGYDGSGSVVCDWSCCGLHIDSVGKVTDMMAWVRSYYSDYHKQYYASVGAHGRLFSWALDPDEKIARGMVITQARARIDEDRSRGDEEVDI